MLDCHSVIKHSALLYNSKEELFSFSISYFKIGLQRNELCLWILPDAISIDEATLALKGAIDRLESYIEKGQLLITDKNFYVKEGVFISSELLSSWAEREKRAIQSGFSGICAIGDGSWGLKDSWFNLLFYEQEVEKDIHLTQMRALCSYSLEKLDMDKILKIGELHKSSFVCQNGQWVNFKPDTFKRDL